MAHASEHWNRLWSEKDASEVSWFESTPADSLAMIEEIGLPRDAALLDVGGGASGLPRELRARDYSDVTVADISAAAIGRAKAALGPDASGVEWLVADVRDHRFERRYALWHDRAVFHFMIDPEDRRGYVASLESALEPGGHVVIATFGPEGPTSCSGLPVARYDADSLAEALAPVARLVASHLSDHTTPKGSRQQFLHARLQAPSPS